MEIRVAPKVAGQANQPNTAYDIYFVNSFNTSAWCQKEATYETRFTASFPVMGGGTITLVDSRYELPHARRTAVPSRRRRAATAAPRASST